MKRLTTFIAVAIVVAGISIKTPLAQSPEIAEAMAAGEAALKAKKWEDALKAFKQASAAADKKSAAAHFGMAKAYHGLAAFKNEAASCLEALKVVGDDQSLEGTLHNQRGMALFMLAEKNTDKVLQEAEAEFRAALPLSGVASMARFNLGTTIMRQGRDEEGIEMLKSSIAAGLKAPELDNAKKMIENPRRARENFAPVFSFTTRSGEFVESDDLLGKTVLLDFWGTWCPPCRAATPGLVQMYKRLQGQPFEMYGISSDPAADKQKWMDYIDQNKMLWPQQIDLGRPVHRAFQIESFPTYIVIDAEGIIRYRGVGFSESSTIATLESEIKKSLKAKKTAPGVSVLQPLPGAASRSLLERPTPASR